jgi:hypothetical protein
MRIHQCPRCELRFRDEADTKDHLVSDHQVDPESLERHLAGWTQETASRRDAPDLMRPRRDND